MLLPLANSKVVGKSLLHTESFCWIKIFQSVIIVSVVLMKILIR